MTPTILLCADFDETITLQDTISLLFQLASCSASKQQQLVAQYVNEMNDYLDNYKAKWMCASTTGNKSFDRTGLHEFLEGYAMIDLRSIERVTKCRALQGIHYQNLVKAARTVQIQPNCVDTFAAVDEWKIISANWSMALVTSVLMQSGIMPVAKTTQIIVNDLKLDPQGVTTGEIDVKVQSPLDKAQWIDKVRSLYTEMQSIIIYVGDSANDLLALLKADVGICFVSDSSLSSSRLLRQLLKNYGIDVRPLRTYKSLADCIATTSDGGNSRPVIFMITDWEQLKQLVVERN
ncbi:hypothetical protein KXD40_001083 [Peronospora effusa]|uniref:Uncharacterized protein n=1 Tax=Peronospora effusa TaxID=542832 RepID=A0A3M6VQN7_9STRA|nr:hypothetical protein DD238_005583 [Peronospora effusa]UIZ21749.1 hypothetical protein KXD40_001083 [Peronospora effusa]CAI5723957.1 unnamed protein product [Peronospora effusa]